METNISIGKLAEKTGVGIETIRFYEREGLIPNPPRTAEGYRKYSADSVLRVSFIRYAKDLGFSLKEIPVKLIFTSALLLLFGCAAPSSTTTTAPRQADGTHLCSDCDLKYADQAMAQKCHDWCTTEHSCNAEITQHAIGSVSNH